jgi:glutamine amidotransferase
MSSVALIDYGAGNLRSVERALEAGGATVSVTADPAAVRTASRIVLPGQGAFADCMSGLTARPGLIDALKESVLEHGLPFLGICVGMQLLADIGLEHGQTAGLGWIGGTCRQLQVGKGEILPHTGWNEVTPTQSHPVLDGLAPTRHCYFNHSFILDAPADAIAATTTHGERFACAVARNNLVGVQFHPEKSQRAGLDLLSRFLKWAP